VGAALFAYYKLPPPSAEPWCLAFTEGLVVRAVKQAAHQRPFGGRSSKEQRRGGHAACESMFVLRVMSWDREWALPSSHTTSSHRPQRSHMALSIHRRVRRPCSQAATSKLVSGRSCQAVSFVTVRLYSIDLSFIVLLPTVPHMTSLPSHWIHQTRACGSGSQKVQERDVFFGK
jgi:hypothetical protein